MRNQKTWMTAIIVALLGVSAYAEAQPTPEPPVTPNPVGSEDPFAPAEDTAVTSTSTSEGPMPRGTWGIGVASTVSGVVGTELEYYLGSVLLTGIAGVAIFSPDMGDTATAFGFGGGGFFQLAGNSEVALMLGGRAILVIADNGAQSGVNFNLEVPARFQWYVSPNFSLHAEAGLAIKVIGDAGDPSTFLGKGTQFRIGAGNVLGGVGATVYF